LADPKLQERVLYDMGDARYRLGTTTLKDAPDQTIERWKAAVAAYEGALALSPTDGDARFNRDFVKRKLAELENKQKDPPKENPSKPQPNKGDSKNEQAGQKGASNGKGSDQTSPSNDTKPNGASGDAGSHGQTPSDSAQGRDPSKVPHPNSPSTEGRNATGAAGSQNPADQGSGSTRKEEAREGGTAGGLSPRDARALLQSLRGEEKRGVSFGTSSAPPTGDSPQKDW
jgi:Mg-chelatase subunit ChlI